MVPPVLAGIMLVFTSRQNPRPDRPYSTIPVVSIGQPCLARWRQRVQGTTRAAASVEGPNPDPVTIAYDSPSRCNASYSWLVAEANLCSCASAAAVIPDNGGHFRGKFSTDSLYNKRLYQAFDSIEPQDVGVSCAIRSGRGLMGGRLPKEVRADAFTPESRGLPSDD
jgi:hypothetical protein